MVFTDYPTACPSNHCPHLPSHYTWTKGNLFSYLRFARGCCAVIKQKGLFIPDTARPVGGIP